MKSLKDLSIINILMILFLSALIIALSSIGYLVFSSWFFSARNMTENMAGLMNENIYKQIYNFLHTPEHMNNMYYGFIQNGVVKLSDENERDAFFVEALIAHSEEVYSFSFGSINGEYYGARRNDKGEIEIMKNNAETGGNSWYYSINSDLTPDKLVLQAGQFDPRTRQWYKAAMKARNHVFSPVYEHFVMEDLTISAARPIYSGDGVLQGVLGTHMLLSGIETYLDEAANNYGGYAVIIEKDTGDLIANSIGIDNFTVLENGSFKRKNIREVENSEIIQAYEKFVSAEVPDFLHKGEKENYYMSMKGIHMEGLDWVVIAAIPEGLLMSPVTNNIHMTLYISAAAVLVLLLVYYSVTRGYLKPVSTLLNAAEAFSNGDLSRRVYVVRNDEFGRISASFNNLADKMQLLVNNLEAAVKERTEELYMANKTLEDNKKQLRLILDSAAEGIFGNDKNGNCTFCNLSSIKMLGYSREEDLIGKNIHMLIHHTKADGKPHPLDECKIQQSTREGKGIHSDDDVFWKADGTPFMVEYRSYPQIENGNIIGSVVTFTDITERKKREERIEYLSYHDTLTGLYNRRFFHENRIKIDNADNLPLSVIFADINGLKMTNDIFGHAAGDSLIKKSAEILKQSCRDSDIVERVGGDEFIILLPKTSHAEVQKILTRIRKGFSNEKVAAIKCSISIGSDTKTSIDQSIEEVFTNAEDAMYKDKSMNRKAVNADIIKTIIDTLHTKSPGEKQHSEVVSELCEKMGAALNLSETEINRLKRAGYLHDIGKIVLDNETLLEGDYEDDSEKMRQHSIVGYRLLNLFDNTLDLAEYVYNHHERWDGKGYPSGLKGEEIP
ncbi:MAG: diguanylate cyclase, partial [Acetivibrionales bacterium]